MDDVSSEICFDWWTSEASYGSSKRYLTSCCYEALVAELRNNNNDNNNNNNNSNNNVSRVQYNLYDEYNLSHSTFAYMEINILFFKFREEKQSVLWRIGK